MGFDGNDKRYITVFVALAIGIIIWLVLVIVINIQWMRDSDMFPKLKQAAIAAIVTIVAVVISLIYFLWDLKSSSQGIAASLRFICTLIVLIVSSVAHLVLVILTIVRSWQCLESPRAVIGLIGIGIAIITIMTVIGDVIATISYPQQT